MPYKYALGLHNRGACPIPGLLKGLGEHRKLLQWVWGKAPSNDGFLFCGTMKCILGHENVNYWCLMAAGAPWPEFWGLEWSPLGPTKLQPTPSNELGELLQWWSHAT